MKKNEVGELNTQGLKRDFTFVDSTGSKCVATAEITLRNGYAEFTASGNYENGSGQIFDHIKPANDAQQEFIELWHKWHLKDIGSVTNFESQLIYCIDSIIEHEEERRGKPLSLDDGALIALIEDKTSYLGRDAELFAALVRMFDLSENDFDDVEVNDTNVTVQGINYLAGTDLEMDDCWNEELDNYLDEYVLSDLPDTAQRYFDREGWKSDARYDGRGHSLNRYDGSELEEKINGTYYYAYQQ